MPAISCPEFETISISVALGGGAKMSFADNKLSNVVIKNSALSKFQDILNLFAVILVLLV